MLAKTGTAPAAVFLIAVLGVSLAAGPAAAGHSKQKAVAGGRFHRSYAGPRFYDRAATSPFAPGGNFEASHGLNQPPTQDPRDAWDGYFANPESNPIQTGSQGL